MKANLVVVLKEMIEMMKFDFSKMGVVSFDLLIVNNSCSPGVDLKVASIEILLGTRQTEISLYRKSLFLCKRVSPTMSHILHISIWTLLYINPCLLTNTAESHRNNFKTFNSEMSH